MDGSTGSRPRYRISTLRFPSSSYVIHGRPLISRYFCTNAGVNSASAAGSHSSLANYFFTFDIILNFLPRLLLTSRLRVCLLVAPRSCDLFPNSNDVLREALQESTPGNIIHQHVHGRKSNTQCALNMDGGVLTHRSDIP